MNKAAGTSKRLHIFLAGGILALCWTAFDLAVHSEPAAAVETIDLVPIGDALLDGIAAVTPTAPVVAPIAAAVSPVTSPLAPLIENLLPVIDPLLPVAAPLVDSVLVPVEAGQFVTTSVTPNAAVLPLSDAVAAASADSILLAPFSGSPLNAPPAPSVPTGSSGSTSVALYGELNSGFPAGIGAFGSREASVNDLPSSPAFASADTPD